MRKVTGCLLVIGVIIVLISTLLIAVVVLQKPSKNSIVELAINLNIVEERLSKFPDKMFQGEVTTVKDILDILKNASNDSKISGVILKIAPFNMGMAKVQEVRDAIEEFKKSGKFIYSYMEYGGNKEYFLACAAKKVYLLPNGRIDLTGIMSEAYFFRGMFRKLEIYPDFEHMGKYKSGSEAFTREDMSPAQREVVNSILDDYYEQLISGIGNSRRLSKSKVVNIIDQGPLLPEEILQQGLIDELVYEDEFYELVKEENEGALPIINGKKYLLQKSGSALFKPKIALVYGCGTIVSGPSFYHPLAGKIMGSDTVADALKKARESSSIKAIIFRIDSPGGSAIASDVIWREVMLAKGKKPIIVSMSDVAGSGGYWIAMSADKIVAQPGTITGSIGVYGGKYNLKDFYNKKLGINKEIISRGKHATIYSDYQNFTEDERKVYIKSMKDIYHTFVSKVAKGRNLSYEEVDAIAQGRVWTGEQGKELGLVDELGGLDKAISLAKKAANISPETDIQFVVYPKEKGWPGFLFESVSVKQWQSFMQIDPAVRLSAQLQQLNQEKFLLLMPYYLEFH